MPGRSVSVRRPRMVAVHLCHLPPQNPACGFPAPCSPVSALVPYTVLCRSRGWGSANHDLRSHASHVSHPRWLLRRSAQSQSRRTSRQTTLSLCTWRWSLWRRRLRRQRHAHRGHAAGPFSLRHRPLHRQGSASRLGVSNIAVDRFPVRSHCARPIAVSRWPWASRPADIPERGSAASGRPPRSGPRFSSGRGCAAAERACSAPPAAGRLPDGTHCFSRQSIRAGRTELRQWRAPRVPGCPPGW